MLSQQKLLKNTIILCVLVVLIVLYEINILIKAISPFTKATFREKKTPALMCIIIDRWLMVADDTMHCKMYNFMSLISVGIIYYQSVFYKDQVNSR